jgi:hypothetical protein
MYMLRKGRVRGEIKGNMEIAGIHNSDWITVCEGKWNAEDWSTAGSPPFPFPPWPHRAPFPPLVLALVGLEEE